VIPESLQLEPFCPICDKFLYDPETEYPHICGKHLIDEDLKRFFEKIVAAINTIISEVEALEGGEEVQFGGEES
jgi:hypothetical protein